MKYKFINRHTQSETGGPARLPAQIQVAWRWDTQIKLVYGEEKIFVMNRTRPLCTLQISAEF